MSLASEYQSHPHLRRVERNVANADHHTANVIPVIRYIGPLRGAQVWTPDQRGMQKPVTQNCSLKSLGSGAKIAASPAAALSPGAGD